uniref:Endo/exonuclease/phosphatase domain-containing protein n=1 Tax=Strongyloides papillosus TaxID=174720 RepID=A0A0N5BFQ1_STREA
MYTKRVSNSNTNNNKNKEEFIKVKVGTFNTRGGLKSWGVKQKLLEDLKSLKINITFINETKNNQTISEKDEGVLISVRAAVNSSGGTGFIIIGDKLIEAVSEIKHINNRVSCMVINIKNKKLGLICTYAPNETCQEKDRKDFYHALQSNFDILKLKTDFVIIGGDFNATLGREVVENVKGKYSFNEETNENGSALIEYAIKNKLVIVDSFFPKRPGKQWTWAKPGAFSNNPFKRSHLKCLDYFLTNRKQIFDNVESVSFEKFNPTLSDHRLKIASIRCSLISILYVKFSRFIQRKKDPFQTMDTVTAVADHLGGSLVMGDDNVDKLYDILIQFYNKVAKNVTNEIVIMSRIPEDIQKLFSKRRELKAELAELILNENSVYSIKNIELNILNKLLRRELNNYLEKEKITRLKAEVEKDRGVKKVFRNLFNRKQAVPVPKNDIYKFYSELYGLSKEEKSRM